MPLSYASPAGVGSPSAARRAAGLAAADARAVARGGGRDQRLTDVHGRILRKIIS